MLSCYSGEISKVYIGLGFSEENSQDLGKNLKLKKYKMNSRKFLIPLLAGILACARPLITPEIRREIETYKVLEKIGVNPDIYKVDNAQYDLKNQALYFGDSYAMFNLGGRAVYVWHLNPNTNDLLGTSRIIDFDGNGLVDLVKIEKNKDDGKTLVYRIFNLDGPQSAVLDYYVVRLMDIEGHDSQMDKVLLVAPDEAAIRPFQRIFDRLKQEVKD